MQSSIDQFQYSKMNPVDTSACTTSYLYYILLELRINHYLDPDFDVPQNVLKNRHKNTKTAIVTVKIRHHDDHQALIK